MRINILAAAALTLPGCAIQTVNRVCSVNNGYAIGSAEYQECHDRLVAERQVTVAAAKAQAAENRKAMLQVLAVGLAGYGEAKSAQQPTGAYRSPTIPGGTYYLQSQWLDGGQRFCNYSNGTTLNVGVNLCPATIKG